MHFSVWKLLVIALLVGIIVFFASCKKNASVTLSSGEFSKLMSSLSDKDDTIRFTAIDQIKKCKPNKEQALYMIRAAKTQYPKAQYEWQDISAVLIDQATENPHDDYIRAVKEVFPELNKHAKSSALRFLQQFGKKASIGVYMDLVTQYYKELDDLPYIALERDPKYGDTVFPRILECIDNPSIEYNIYLLTLKYLQNGLISVDKEDKFVEHLLSECSKNRDRIEYIQKSEDKKSWIWDNNDYLGLRYKQSIILDLLGFVNCPESIAQLQEGLNYKDNRLKYFAIVSMLNHSKEVNDTVTETVAADPETRNLLYDGLKKHNRLNLYPSKYKNQAAFAESDMVNWLIYPTELGRAPDEIELMKVVSEDTKTSDGVIEFYLFRFKSNAPDWADKDWMAGLSGPFLAKDGLNTDSYGYTFSAFEKWEEKPIDEHVAEIREIINNWKANK
jgi:hypothetical protein